MYIHRSKDTEMRLLFSFIIFYCFCLFSKTHGDYDVCPGELTKPGGKAWEACMSNDQCGPDEICAQSSAKYPGLWVCVRKPCRFHTECKRGYYCRKKYDHPMITYAFKGICCKGDRF